MMKRFLGVASLLEVGAASLIGAWAMSLSSLVTVVAYVIFLAVGGLLVTYSFCAKCPCRRYGCAHVLPGRIACLYHERAQSSYAPWELIVVSVVVGVLIFMPLPWLWSRWIALAIYGVLMSSAFAIIRSKICRGCDNELCPLSRESPLKNMSLSSSRQIAP